MKWIYAVAGIGVLVASVQEITLRLKLSQHKTFRQVHNY